jgi:integrase
MKTNPQAVVTAALDNILPLPTPTGAQKRNGGYREPFKLQTFTNRGGSESWRVTGMKRDGTRVRENHADLKFAECRKVELTTEWLARETDTAIRATKLTDTQLRMAEAAYLRLDADHELMLAVEHWLKHGRQNAVAESPRLDEAVEAFKQWLDSTPTLRDRTKANLRLRVNVFANSIGNLRVSDVTPETIESFLEKRNTSPRSKINDRLAVSRFFRFCVERPRRWATTNPCRDVRVEKSGDTAAPAVLTVSECKKLLRAAEHHRKGRLAPYVALCLFGGLRPFEASRLAWEQVNLKDREIRLEANQTKTKRGRVLTIDNTLAAWLEAHKGKPIFPANWRKDFDKLKATAGYDGRAGDDGTKLKPWPEDVLRHTAISHYFRHTGSYGRTAEQFGNSEAIIKRHYQGRVSSEDTKAFYALLPKKGGRK